MREMVRCRGTQFDPELIDALEDALADVRGRRGGRTFA
jgi:HD-GYP domain-containing protein (c-di-GMP phosphodiesterase class II)